MHARHALVREKGGTSIGLQEPAELHTNRRERKTRSRRGDRQCCFVWACKFQNLGLNLTWVLFGGLAGVRGFTELANGRGVYRGKSDFFMGEENLIFVLRLGVLYEHPRGLTGLCPT